MQISGDGARAGPFHSGRRISGCQLRADRDSGRAGRRRSERIRRRRSRSGHLPFSWCVQRSLSSVSPAFPSHQAGRTGQEPSFDDSYSAVRVRRGRQESSGVWVKSARRRTRLSAYSAAVRARRRSEQEGKTLSKFPVEAVSFAGRDAEAPDVVRIIEETRRRLAASGKTSPSSTARI